MESKLILYHSNKENECNQFICEKEYLILSKNKRDDIWLGKGMYFWDNKGNAYWWNRKQCKKNPNIQYIIVAANARLDELLDLTDFDVYIKLEELWQNICRKIQRNSDVPLGNKLDFLFDIQHFKKKYAIIKVYGKYNSTPNRGIFRFDYSTVKKEPTIGVKCIYSIRDGRCIEEKELVEQGGKDNGKNRKFSVSTKVY